MGNSIAQVMVLSKLEHPHIVKLTGVCQESCTLVYEYLPNGTLLDRLSKGLPWEDRVRILAELRSALAYLQFSPPQRHHPRRPEADQCPPRRRRREPAGRFWDGADGAREAP